MLKKFKKVTVIFSICMILGCMNPNCVITAKETDHSDEMEVVEALVRSNIYYASDSEEDAEAVVAYLPKSAKLE